MIQESETWLTPQVSRMEETAGSWLNSRCEILSRLLGCTVSYLSFAGSQLAVLLLVAALVLASEAFQAYGWAVCCLLLAGRLLRPLFMEYKKGGAR